MLTNLAIKARLVVVLSFLSAQLIVAAVPGFSSLAVALAMGRDRVAVA